MLFFAYNNNLMKIYSAIIECALDQGIKYFEKRIVKPVELGGLGLLDLAPFLSAQGCAWVE
jgi:hypothetical protein